MKTLADLKRLPPGTRVRLVNTLMGPVPADRQLRTVHKLNSVDMILIPDYDTTIRSHCQLPKAINFEATSNGFKIYVRGGWNAENIYDDTIRRLAAEYIFV
jgi:hypothetical protein